MSHRPTHSAARLTFWLLPLAVCSCIGQPPAEQQGTWATTRRIVAIDFGRDSIEQRTEHRELLQRWWSHSMLRPQSLTKLPVPLRAEFARTGRIGDGLAAAAKAEVGRHPDHLPELLPSSRDWAVNVANDSDTLWHQLWPESPLGEIDDQRHRTRYDDDHDEASLWRRLMRRLRL